jgi:hypothetical protein
MQSHYTSKGVTMSPLKSSNNIAARMGRWSASHWKTAVFGWLAFVAVALYIGQVAGTKQIDQHNANVGQSHKADQMLLAAGFQTDPRRNSCSSRARPARRTIRPSARS